MEDDLQQSKMCAKRTTHTPLDQFPDDILFKIFKILNQKNVPSVMRVSQRFNNLMKSEILWEEYARRAWLIMENTGKTNISLMGLPDGYYRDLVKKHSLPSFFLLDGENTDFPGNSWATGISADGSIIVGYAHTDNEEATKAFRWTQEEGMRPLDKEKEFYSRAKAISMDGSVIIGHKSLWPRTAVQGFRWTCDRVETIGTNNCCPTHVNADGSVIVGYSGTEDDTSATRAFQWTKEKGMQFLRDSTNMDGSLIVGTSNDGPIKVLYYTQEEQGGPLICLNGPMLSERDSTNTDNSVIVGYSEEDPYSTSAFR